MVDAAAVSCDCRYMSWETVGKVRARPEEPDVHDEVVTVKYVGGCVCERSGVVWSVSVVALVVERLLVVADVVSC